MGGNIFEQITAYTGGDRVQSNRVQSGSALDLISAFQLQLYNYNCAAVFDSQLSLFSGILKRAHAARVRQAYFATCYIAPAFRDAGLTVQPARSAASREREARTGE